MHVDTFLAVRWYFYALRNVVLSVNKDSRLCIVTQYGFVINDEWVFEECFVESRKYHIVVDSFEMC